MSVLYSTLKRCQKAEGAGPLVLQGHMFVYIYIYIYIYMDAYSQSFGLLRNQKEERFPFWPAALIILVPGR